MADARPALQDFTETFGLVATAIPQTWVPEGWSWERSVSIIWDAYKPDVEESSAVEDYDSDWASFRKDQVADMQVGDTFIAPRREGEAASQYRVLRVLRRRDPEFFHVAVD